MKISKRFMYAALAAILCINFVSIMGCSCTRADQNGVITQNTTNCLLAGQDMICNASPDVMAGADLLITILKGVASAYIPGTPEATAFISAQNIQKFGCSTATGLNALIAYLQSAQAKSMIAKAGPMKAVVPISPQPFINWRDTK